MIIKRTWNQIIENPNLLTIKSKLSSENTELMGLFNSIQTLFQSNIGFTTYTLIKDLFVGVSNNYWILSTGQWKELPIYLSSYKEGDVRVWYQIYQRLLQYLGFYKKMLTDNGLLKTITINHSYLNTGSNSSTNKNYNSETPQIELENFEEGIKFASNLGKNENQGQLSNNGEANTSTESKTWQEAMENTKLVFYNSLVEYIMRLPNILYSYYALDTVPYPALVCETFKQLANIYEIESEA